ncbi:MULTISPECIES: MogA/MoaB family molybdenum cofactor biosynthesis protein [unclassified Archaeoglobus]|jgi:molybdenum cofactor biosynthesis protein B|uniref:MogA/MoaB family molybdenum cofactor biosynthesis protein n=1 Tax=unclassified Archaeoglobus TaxID=2643606 RepID=UPI0025C3C0DD|nr:MULTISPECIES: MogA/MoaB family molybdenum cofactor biosynthesis protein [unclassified Archaeoglobus]
MHEGDVDFKVAVITVSTSRYEKYGELRGVDKIRSDDESGKLIYESFEGNVVDYFLVPDDAVKIQKSVLDALSKADVCILTGGTGLNPTDVTIEAVEPLFTKKIDGFGEIFRMLSYNEVGYASILSRAMAGLIKDKVVFCLPGSKKAVRLGLEIIKSSLKHILSHAKGLS